MKLSSRYNRVNLLTSLIVLLITGLVYYAVIHFILTEKLDRDLTVEENEINQYVNTYHKLPLPASYLDQQVVYKELKPGETIKRAFFYKNYYNPKKKEKEPSRSLVTRIDLLEKSYRVTITKSRVESEELIRIILFITIGITLFLLVLLMAINRFILNSLWKPFYTILHQMKIYDVTSMESLKQETTQIDEFNELNETVNAMALRVQQDYKELKNFTDNASHEMMTPLAVINSKLDSLLQTESFTLEQGSILEDIYLATGKLSRLHQSLLLLAKIENNLIADLQEIDLREITEVKVRQFNELFAKEDLKVTTSLLPTKISMSRYLADILLNNLFTNALKHNQKGGSIEIKLDQKSLQVINTGKHEAIEEKLFDKFSKSSESEGMGLGLAITKQICNLNNMRLDYKYLDEKHFFTVFFNS